MEKGRNICQRKSILGKRGEGEHGGRGEDARNVAKYRNWGPTLRMLSDFQLKTKQPGNMVHRDAVSFGATHVDLSYVLASCFLKFFIYFMRISYHIF